MVVTIATVQRMDPSISQPFEDAITEVLGVTVERREMRMLAGPNHTIQILMDAADWARLGSAIVLAYAATVFSKSFLERAGELAADKIFKATVEKGTALDSSATERLVERLLDHTSSAQRASHSVILGLPDVDRFRNVGIEVSPVDDATRDQAREKLVRIIAMLGASAALVEQFLKDHDRSRGADEQNSDCSIRIRATEAGKLKVRFSTKEGKRMVAVFDLTGCTIEDAPPPEDIDDFGNPINLPEEEL